MVKSKIIDYPIKQPLEPMNGRWLSKNNLILFFLMGLGGFFRVYNLGKYNLWFDESFSILQANAPFRIISKYDFTAPFYTFFISIWSRAFHSDFSLRLSSAIFGTLSIWLIYYVGVKLFSVKTGLIGAFLLAVSPFNIYYSQELRMYSLMVFLSLLSIIFLLKSLKKQRWYYWAGYALFNLLNIYTHYIGVFLLASGILFSYYTVYRKSQYYARWLAVNLAVILLFSPWALIVSMQYMLALKNPSQYIWFNWYEPVSLYTLLMTFKNFSIGYNASRLIYAVSLALFFILFIIGIVKSAKNKNMLFCIWGLFLPIIAVFLLSKARPMYADRYFISSSVFYYLIIANGVISFKDKKNIFIILILISIAAGAALTNFYKNILPVDYHECLGAERKRAHRDVALYIKKQMEPLDQVYHVWNNTVYPFLYYFNKSQRQGGNILEGDKEYGKIISIDNKSNLLCVHKLGLNGIYRPISENVLGKANQRFWVIVSSWTLGVNPEKESWENDIVKRLDKDYRRLSYKAFDGVVVCLYEAYKIIPNGK